MMDRKNNTTGGTGTESSRKKYITFISYTKDDFPIVKEIYKFLNGFKIPRKIRKEYRQNNLPKRLRTRIFFATDRADAGPLRDNIKEALDASESVTVMCSPDAPKSKWVNDEIEMFAVSNDKSKIYPFIVSNPTGERDISKIYAQYYPENLVRVLNNVYGEDKAKDFLAPNVDEVDAQTAAIKSIAYTLGVPFGELNEYYKKEERQRRRWKYLISLGVIVFLAVFLGIIYSQYRENMINQSRAVAQAAERLVDDGDIYTAQRICIEALPKKLDWWRLWERPYVPEAGTALSASVLDFDTDFHSVAVLRGHTDNIFYIDVSPDDKQIASASSDYTAKIWDMETGQELHSLEHGDVVFSVMFSPDGKNILTASADKTMRIWNAETGELIHTSMYNTPCNSATYSPDNKKIAVALASSTIIVYDASDFNILQELDWAYGGMPTSVHFSPDNKKILTVSDSAYSVFDVGTGELIHQNYGPHGGICFGEFSPDGSMIMLDGDMLDSETFNIITSLSAYGSYWPAYGRFSHDGRLVVSSSYNFDGRILIFDISELNNNYNNNYNKQTLYKGSTAIALCSDGNKFVTGSDGSTVRIWERKPHNASQVLKNSKLSSDCENIIYINDDNSIRKWNINSGEDIKISIDDVDAPHYCGRIIDSRDGKLAYETDDDVIKIADEITGKTIRIIQPDSQASDRIFSPKFDKIAFYETTFGNLRNDIFQRQIYVYDTYTGQLVRTFSEYNQIKIVRFSPDGNMLMSVIRDTIRIWNIESGKEIYKKRYNNASSPDAKFSHDGTKVLYTTAQGLNIIDLNTQVEYIHKTEKRVEAANFSADGRYVAFYDSNYQVLDLYKGKILYYFTIPKLYNPRETVFNSENNKFIISLNFGNDTYIIDFPPLQELINQTRERFKDRPLTDEEREQYYLL